MQRFKVGDKVRCVDQECSHLTKGKVYTVVNTHYGDLLDVQNDKGDIASYFMLRFKAAEKETEMNIDQEIAELEKALQSLKDKKKEQDREYPVGSLFDVRGVIFHLVLTDSLKANLVNASGSRYFEDSIEVPMYSVKNQDLERLMRGVPFKYLGQCEGFKVKE